MKRKKSEKIRLLEAKKRNIEKRVRLMESFIGSQEEIEDFVRTRCSQLSDRGHTAYFLSDTYLDDYVFNYYADLYDDEEEHDIMVEAALNQVNSHDLMKVVINQIHEDFETMEELKNGFDSDYFDQLLELTNEVLVEKYLL